MSETLLPEKSLWGLLTSRVRKTPDAIMATDDLGRSLTFASYMDEAERAAAGLADLGVAEGTVVSWELPTWFESAVLVGALSRLGAIQNPMLHIYRDKEVRFISQQADAKLLIVPSVWNGFDFETMARDIADERAGVEVLVVDRNASGPALPQGDPQDLPPLDDPESEADAVRWLFYTSGTTADPKGAQHSDANIAAVGAGMAERLDLSTADRNSMIFPFTHIGGITWLFTSFQTGCGNIFLEAFHPENTPVALTKDRCTVAGAGTIFHQTYLSYANSHPDEEVLPDVRVFAGGGAPKPPQLHYDMVERFGAPILSGYGLTEAPILTMAGTTDSDFELANSEGSAMPGVDLKLVTLGGEVAGVGEEGEIRAKAPQLMLGYLDPSLDADAFDDDGYFRTGDLGTLDENGNLAITGRLKDIIIRKGENVSAKEVEDHLYSHPKVSDAAVIGLPDERSGERVCAVVSLNDPLETLELDEIVKYLTGEGLMIQKCPGAAGNR